MMMISLPES